MCARLLPEGGMRRLSIAGGATVVLFVATPGWAHVTVHADNATRGGSDVAVAFRVPSENEQASTVKVQVFFPMSTPLLGVLVQPHPGWTAAVKTATLTNPVKTDDGTISEVVSEVTWTPRSPADALRAGQSADFVVTAGQLPDAPTVTFKALQTYSTGDVVRWIEVAAPGAPEPEHPAPTLDLAGGSAGSAAPTQAPTQAPTAAARSGSDGVARGLGIAALVVALLAAAAALRRSRR
jgi:uncharacterized protein YcnI